MTGEQPAYSYEGIPTYRNPDRFWAFVEEICNLSIIYTSPTANSWPDALWRGNGQLSTTSLALRLPSSVVSQSTLKLGCCHQRHLGTVGCADHGYMLWQTETGASRSASSLLRRIETGQRNRPFTHPTIESDVVDKKWRQRWTRQRAVS